MTNARTLSVDAGGIMLRRGGQPFFSTADTPWCAFMRPSPRFVLSRAQTVDLVRRAATAFAPWPTALTRAVDEPAEWTASQWTLEDRRRRHPRITIRPGELYVDNPAAMGDSVLLLTRPNAPRT